MLMLQLLLLPLSSNGFYKLLISNRFLYKFEPLFGLLCISYGVHTQMSMSRDNHLFTSIVLPTDTRKYFLYVF